MRRESRDNEMGRLACGIGVDRKWSGPYQMTLTLILSASREMIYKSIWFNSEAENNLRSANFICLPIGTHGGRDADLDRPQGSYNGQKQQEC